MPKRLNNRPWPQNLFYDFGLSAISPADAKAFVAGLPTTERNRTFLLLRYREGKTYKEIAATHGMTPAGERLAIIAMQEKFGGEAASAAAPSPVPATPPPAVSTPHPAVSTPHPAVSTPHPADNNATKESSRPLSINLDAIRRFLGLTPEEFARPLPIEDGESLITRLETGFSRPAPAVLDLICEAWGISRPYLLTGRGEMFDLQPYCSALTTLLKKYLA